MKKLLKNRAPISDEEIASTQNFSEVMGLYNKQAQPKAIKKYSMYGLAACAAAIMGIVAYNYIHTSEEVAATRPFVNPPVAGVNIPDTTLKVDASVGATFTMPSGSMIEIPADAFVDEAGNSIKGYVDILYREFRKPTEFFVSGIPMTYDSAGTTYTFESAGMFDIKGMAGGKPVRIRDGKNIKVKVASVDDAEKYNSYILDTVKKAWVYLGSSPLEKSDEVALKETDEVMTTKKKAPEKVTELTKDGVLKETGPESKEEFIPDWKSSPKSKRFLYTRELDITPFRFKELDEYFGKKVKFDLSVIASMHPEIKTAPDSHIVIRRMKRSISKPGYYHMNIEFKSEKGGKETFVFENDFEVVLDEVAFLAAKEMKAKLIKAKYADRTPIKPIKMTDPRFILKIEVDGSDFPELAIYNNIYFEFPQSSMAAIPSGLNLNSTTFSEARVSRTYKEGYYNIWLTQLQAQKSPVTICLVDGKPVFKGADYADAMKAYADYERRLKTKNIQQEREQKVLEEQGTELADAYNRYQKSREEFLKRQAVAWERQKKVNYIESVGYRVFQVKEFGMYNSDCPSNMPVGAQMFVNIVDDKGKAIGYHTLYMVDHGKNALFSVYKSSSKTYLSYNPESTTTFWVVTTEGKIACMDAEAVKKLKVSKEGINDVTLSMQVSDKELKTESEIADFLNLD